MSGGDINSSVGTTVFAVGSSVTAAISGSTIEDGEANQGVGCQGGGIYNRGTLTVTDATLWTTVRRIVGAAVSSMTAARSRSSRAPCRATAAKLAAAGSTVSPARSPSPTAFCRDSGGQGAGIYNASGTVTLTGSTVSHSGLSGTGAGILNDGTLNVTDGSTVSDDAVTGAFGGGIWNGGTLNVTDSTVSGNSALNESGGGIADDGTATIADSTLFGNTAPGPGGGIYNENTSSDPAVNVTDSTLSGNSTGSWAAGSASLAAQPTSPIARFRATARVKTAAGSPTSGGRFAQRHPRYAVGQHRRCWRRRRDLS